VASAAAHRADVMPRGSTLAALAGMGMFLCLRRAPQFDVLIFFLSAALIIAVVCSKDDFGKVLLRGKFLRFLGLISYSIYMSHTFVLWICNQIVRVVLRRPESIADGISTPQLSVWVACLWYGLAVGATLALSALVFKYVEDPFRMKAKEFTRRHMTLHRGAVGVIPLGEDRT
jgi:peptidoglycan/LPS O-acetylase OafA/YrhL